MPSGMVVDYPALLDGLPSQSWGDFWSQEWRREIGNSKEIVVTRRNQMKLEAIWNAEKLAGIIPRIHLSEVLFIVSAPAHLPLLLPHVLTWSVYVGSKMGWLIHVM